MKSIQDVSLLLQDVADGQKNVLNTELRKEEPIGISNHSYHLQFQGCFPYTLLFDPQISVQNVDRIKGLWSNIEGMVIQKLGLSLLNNCVIYSSKSNGEPIFNHKVGSIQVTILRSSQNVSKQEQFRFLIMALTKIMRSFGFIDFDYNGNFVTMKDSMTIGNVYLLEVFSIKFQYKDSGLFLNFNLQRSAFNFFELNRIIDQILSRNSEKNQQQKLQQLRRILKNHMIITKDQKQIFSRINNILYEDSNNIVFTEQCLPLQEYLKSYNLQNSQNSSRLLIVEIDVRRKVVRHGREDQQTFLLPEHCFLLQKRVSENFVGDSSEQILHQSLIKADIKSEKIQHLVTMLSEQFKEAKIQLQTSSQSFIGFRYRQHRDIWSDAVFSNENRQVLEACIMTKEQTDLSFRNYFQQISLKKLDMEFRPQVLSSSMQNYPKMIEQIQKFLETMKQKRIFIIIIPDHIKSSVNKLMKYFWKKEMLCQILLEKDMETDNRQNFTELFFKIQAKIGNTIERPRLYNKTNKVVQNICIFGIDKWQKSGVQLFTCCYSIDGDFMITKQSNCIAATKSRKDRFQALLNILLSSISCYINKNQLPDEIFIFLKQNSKEETQLLRFVVHEIQRRMFIHFQHSLKATIFLVFQAALDKLYTLPKEENKDSISRYFIRSNKKQKSFYHVFENAETDYQTVYSTTNLSDEDIQCIIDMSTCSPIGFTTIPFVLFSAQQSSLFHLQVAENKKIPEELAEKMYFIK